MKRLIFCAVMILLIIVVVGALTELPKTIEEKQYLSVMCYPGWPSGWWIADCYGVDGGYALVREARE